LSAALWRQACVGVFLSCCSIIAIYLLLALQKLTVNGTVQKNVLLICTCSTATSTREHHEVDLTTDSLSGTIELDLAVGYFPLFSSSYWSELGNINRRLVFYRRTNAHKWMAISIFKPTVFPFSLCDRMHNGDQVDRVYRGKDEHVKLRCWWSLGSSLVKRTTTRIKHYLRVSYPFLAKTKKSPFLLSGLLSPEEYWLSFQR
jgi:hypothetical protein